MKKTRINKKNLLFTILCAIFFIPAEYAIPAKLFSAWQYSIILVAIVIVYKYIAKKKCSRAWLISVFFALNYYILSSFANGRTIPMSGFFLVFKCIGFYTLAEYGTRYQYKSFVKGLLNAGIIMCGIHFLTFVIYTNVRGGMNSGYITDGVETSQHWYFFGHANGSAFYFVPILAIAWFYAFEYDYRYRMNAFIYNVIAILMYNKDKSITAFISCGVLLIVVLFRYNKNITKITNPFFEYIKMHIYGLALSLMVIGLSISGAFLKVFYYFGKVKHAGARALFWGMSLDIFRKHPIWGIGFESDSNTLIRIGKNHCHNMIVQILYTSGLLGILLYFAFIYLCRPQGKNKRKYSLIVLFVAQFILWITSSFDWYLYVVIPFSIFFVVKNYKYDTFMGR